MVGCSRVLRRTAVVCAVLGGLLGIADGADAQGLPGEPNEDQLDAALAVHHSTVLDRGLADGLMVWFIVDADSEVVETGVGDSEGLEESLGSQYPDITSDFAFVLNHITINGRVIPLLWMIPDPPGPVS